MPVSLQHRKRVLKFQERIAQQLSLPQNPAMSCKNKGNAEVHGETGHCLRCGADQGEACRS